MATGNPESGKQPEPQDLEGKSEPSGLSLGRLSFLALVFFSVLMVAVGSVGAGAKLLVLALALLSAVLAAWSASRLARATKKVVSSVLLAIAATAIFFVMYRIANPEIPRFAGTIEPFHQSDPLVDFFDRHQGNDIYLDLSFNESKYVNISGVTPAKRSDPAVLSFYSGCDKPANDFYIAAECTNISIAVEPNPEAPQPVRRSGLVSVEIIGYFSVVNYHSQMSTVSIDLRPIKKQEAAAAGRSGSITG